MRKALTWASVLSPWSLLALVGELDFCICVSVTQATIGKTICVKGSTAKIRPPSSYTASTSLDRSHGILECVA